MIVKTSICSGSAGGGILLEGTNIIGSQVVNKCSSNSSCIDLPAGLGLINVNSSTVVKRSPANQPGFGLSTVRVKMLLLLVI